MAQHAREHEVFPSIRAQGTGSSANNSKASISEELDADAKTC